MRRSFVFATTAAIAASLSTTLLAGTALAQAAAIRQQVIPEGQSASPTLTPGIRVGNMLFASGQLGMSRTAPDTTIQGQTRLALESTKKVFEAAGTTLANATKCTVFLTDVKDFAGMNFIAGSHPNEINTFTFNIKGPFGDLYYLLIFIFTKYPA